MHFPATPFMAKIASSDDALLHKYAEYDIDTQNMAKGERGIVVLSPDGDDPILAQANEYYTGGMKATNQGKGLGNVAGLYQAEQAQLTKMNAGRTVKVDVLFDADHPISDGEENLL